MTFRPRGFGPYPKRQKQESGLTGWTYMVEEVSEVRSLLSTFVDCQEVEALDNLRKLA
jgi:hypothetical protein